MRLKESVEVGRALDVGTKLTNEFVRYGTAGDIAFAGDRLHRDPAELADRTVGMLIGMQ